MQTSTQQQDTAAQAAPTKAAGLRQTEIKNIRARLERWELDHLRALAASLHDQLEAATTRANDAEERLEGWRTHAYELQDELQRLADETGNSIGLTQQGQVLVLKPGDTPETTPPEPGQHWPAQGGTYLGIAPAEGDLPLRHLVALDVEQHAKFNWEKALEHGKLLGNGARLPTQLEALLGFTVAKEAFPKGVVWTSTQVGSHGAFAQYFQYGVSNWYGKDDEFLVAPVRGLDLQTFKPLTVLA